MTATEAIEVSLDDDFISSLMRLDAAKSHRVLEAVELLRKNPDHPNLRLKPLHGDLDQLWSARAGRDVRILLFRRGSTAVLLEAGMRRDVYDRAARGRFIVNPHRRFMGFVEAQVPLEERRTPLPSNDRPTAADQPKVFDHWTDGELREVGLEELEVAALRSCGDEYDLLELAWSEERINLVVRLVETTPEAWRAAKDDGETSESRIRQAIREYGGLTGVSPLLGDEVLAALAAAPVEDWMIFLHPDQRTIVEARHRGPARVRGAAGTGKTVVALHRAAELARRYEDENGRVLFTTVLSNLPPVLRTLFSRLPGSRPDAVDFLALDEVAAQVVAERTGADAQVVDRAAVDAAFTEAWSALVTPGSPLAELGVTAPYVRTEIEKVVKGRALAGRAEYQSVVRVGRRQGLSLLARDHVWDVAEAWTEAMVRAGTMSVPDLVAAALRLVSNGGVAKYRAVVVDEAQDLTLAGLHLLRGLVNGSGPDRADGLFLAGDGAQRIQPGGFTLRQAGVEVRGRTTVLRVNYRCTQEILDAALDAVGGEEVTDLDEEFRRGEQRPATVRRGVPPIVEKCSTAEEESAAIMRLVEGATVDGGVGLGDIAVLAAGEEDAIRWRGDLEGLGIPVVDLADYLGVTTDQVKVGTHADAKGLEFKVVLLPGMGAAEFPSFRQVDEGDEEWLERRGLVRSRLFVAMTRARDLLAITYVDEPAAEIQSMIDVQNGASRR